MIEEKLTVNDRIIYILYHQGELSENERHEMQPQCIENSDKKVYLIPYPPNAAFGLPLTCNKDDLIIREFKNIKSKTQKPLSFVSCIEDYLVLACIIIPIAIGIARYLWINYL